MVTSYRVRPCQGCLDVTASEVLSKEYHTINVAGLMIWPCTVVRQVEQSSFDWLCNECGGSLAHTRDVVRRLIAGGDEQSFGLVGLDGRLRKMQLGRCTQTVREVGGNDNGRTDEGEWRRWERCCGWRREGRKRSVG